MEYFEELTTAVSLREVENHFDYSDMSTLYRTLKTFVEYNILHTIDDGTGKVKYAKCIEGCICLTEQSIPSVILPKNYLMYEANMVVKGTCSECRK